ncbi:uncharacterized protein Mps1 isoform X2 [Periplaneta americana]|uniref:uncharacterized protein Mps1 isoform X2 n=1 Tax=Periplaneta americana TaxID=6978 RepID=UPI0037E95938
MYGYCASSDGDSTSSFPGSRTKSRQKRVSSLGKLRQTPKLPPVPILPLLQQLRDTAKNGCNETSVNDNSDMSLSLNSDASYNEDGDEVMGLNSCGRYRDGAERFSSSYEELSPNMKVDESFGTQELDMQHSEKLRDYILTSQAVEVSESHKYDAYVDHIESSAKKKHCSVELFSQDSNYKKGVYDHISDSDLLTGDKEKMFRYHEKLQFYRESAVTELHRKNGNFQKECSSINNGVISNKGPVLQDIINLPDIMHSKLESKNIKPYQQFEKSENKQSKVDHMPLNFTTPAKNNFTTSYSSSIEIHGNDKMFHLNSITPNLTAKEDFKTPARKNMDCVTLLQQRSMKENAYHSSDIFNSNSERELETAAEKSSRLESQLHDDMFNRERHSFSHNVKKNIPLVDETIPAKQDVSDQKCSTGNSVVHSNSRPVERSSTTNSQSLLLMTDGTDGANTVINAQEYIVMPTAHKSDSGIVQEKSPKENENMSKVVEREGKCIIVNGKEYIIQCVLGRGGSSEVLQVLIPNTSRLLAMKRVKLSVAEPAVAQGYLNEIALLRRLQGSETVIRMMDFEYVKEKQLLYVIMEKGETDLSMLIKDISKTNQIPMTTIVYYWVEMLRAVKNIHAYGIIHSDLKPANFLLVCGRLKLIDFGIASSLQTDMTSVLKDTPTGTFNYMSPEAIPVIHTGSGNHPLTKFQTLKRRRRKWKLYYIRLENDSDQSLLQLQAGAIHQQHCN